MEIEAGLTVGLSAFTEEVRKLRISQRQLARQAVPRNRRENMAPLGGGISAYPASGNLILQSDGPQMGKLWDVRGIIVGGVTATASPAGTAYVFDQVMQPTDLSTSALRTVSMTPFPALATWSDGGFRIRYGASIYLVIVGGTPGTYYTAYADIQEFDDTLATQTVFDV